ncbi:MAG: hypothetical protein ACRDBX_08705 [Erysipelotrichaceae bacterium]
MRFGIITSTKEIYDLLCSQLTRFEYILLKEHHLVKGEWGHKEVVLYLAQQDEIATAMGTQLLASLYKVSHVLYLDSLPQPVSLAKVFVASSYVATHEPHTTYRMDRALLAFAKSMVGGSFLAIGTFGKKENEDQLWHIHDTRAYGTVRSAFTNHLAMFCLMVDEHHHQEGVDVLKQLVYYL